MVVRSLIAAAVLFTFSACCTHLAAVEAPGPVKVTAKTFADEDGNTLTLRLDRTELAKREPLVVTAPDGKRLPLFRYALEEVSICLPGEAATTTATGGRTPAPVCQRASSISDGTFLKLGNASCICRTTIDGLTCYGSTCPKK